MVLKTRILNSTSVKIFRPIFLFLSCHVLFNEIWLNVEFFEVIILLLLLQILQLEKRLQNQVAIRGVLEKALGYNSISLDIGNEISIPKVAHCKHLPPSLPQLVVV